MGYSKTLYTLDCTVKSSPSMYMRQYTNTKGIIILHDRIYDEYSAKEYNARVSAYCINYIANSEGEAYHVLPIDLCIMPFFSYTMNVISYDTLTAQDYLLIAIQCF